MVLFRDCSAKKAAKAAKEEKVGGGSAVALPRAPRLHIPRRLEMGRSVITHTDEPRRSSKILFSAAPSAISVFRGENLFCTNM